MEAKRQPAPLIVIVGPTASGKSALAFDLACQLNGEIICADSRTVYKGMDIGTAKPPKDEQAQVRHHLIDLITPDQNFTAAEFKRQALLWIDDISIRGKVPIMVGGTGLYVDGVIFDFAFLPPVAPEEREALESLSVEALQQKLTEQGIPLPENSKNPRHLIRALETNGQVPVRKGLRENTLVIGLDIDKATCEQRIQHRVEQMYANGFVAEAKQLFEKYGVEAPGLQAPGYKAIREYLDGEVSLDESKKIFIRNDIQLAKRQRTWFKRNPHIHWTKNSSEAWQLVQLFLQQTRTN